MVVGDIRLSIACEMVFDDQDILDDQFLLDTHHNLHGHIVNVYQIQWLSTEDGLHGGYLWLGLEYTAFLTVVDAQHHPLGYTQPPESLSEEAKCAVFALMPQVSMASIYHCLSLQSWHYKYQDIFVAPFRHNLQVKEIAPEYEILLVGSVDAAFCIRDLVFHVVVQCPVVIFPSS